MMQDAIEGNPIFEDCQSKSDIADAILTALDADESPASPQLVAADDKTDFTFSPGAALEHSKNMGVPWGFTVMALN